MQQSTTRILTTHTGSLPRPRELTRLYSLRAREFKRMWTEHHASKMQVSNLGGLPKAIGEVRYCDRHVIDEGCRYFKTALAEHTDAFVEPFMSAPSPGMLAMAMKNEHYDSLEAYLEALGKALQVEYEAIVKHGFVLQVDAPDLALERHITYKTLPTSAFVGLVEQVVAVINKALTNIPRGAHTPDGSRSNP